MEDVNTPATTLKEASTAPVTLDMFWIEMESLVMVRNTSLSITKKMHHFQVLCTAVLTMEGVMTCVSTLKGHMNASAQLSATSWDKIKCLVLVRHLMDMGGGLASLLSASYSCCKDM